MTDSVTAPIEQFRDWEITTSGEFKNRVSKQVLSRQDWEIEMSYAHMNDADALALAKELSKVAAERSKA